MFIELGSAQAQRPRLKVGPALVEPNIPESPGGARELFVRLDETKTVQFLSALFKARTKLNYKL